MGIGLLETFLPTRCEPKDQNQGHLLWFDELTGLWSICHNQVNSFYFLKVEIKIVHEMCFIIAKLGSGSSFAIFSPGGSQHWLHKLGSRDTTNVFQNSSQLWSTCVLSVHFD